MYRSRATLLPFLFVIICPIASGAFVLQMFGGCATEDSLESMTSVNRLVFNKQVLASYSEKLKKFIPCSPAQGCIPQVQDAITQVTNYLNKDGNTSLRMEANIQLCYSNAKRFWRDTAEKTSPPTVQIAPIEPLNEGDPAVLVCYVSDFYPDTIGITWLKNGAPMGPNMTTSIVRSNGNWSYQAQVYLELIPGPGPADEYECWVQHTSLGEPAVEKWQIGLTQLQKIKVSLSAVVLGLGLIFLMSGLIVWRKSHAAGYEHIPGSSYPEVS